MTILQAQRWAVAKLRSRKINSAQLDTDVLLGFVIKRPREHLYTHPEQKLTATEEQLFKKLTTRRARFEPIAYLTEYKEFYGLGFYVNKNVLIPRPETELLIEQVISYTQNQTHTPPQLTIADIGTGSGCVAITIKKLLPTSIVIATDTSPAALTIAKRNAKKHQTTIIFKSGDLLKPIAKNDVDILIANLPYVPNTDKRKITSLNRSLRFEPTRALYSGKDGLNAYRKLFAQIRKLKKLPRAICIEFDPRQKNELKKIIRAHLPQVIIEFKKDLAGKNRVAIVTH